MTPPTPSPRELLKLAHARMPFGKYQGRYLSDLPLSYLIWFRQRGFPETALGRQLAAILEIKDNGLEGLLSQVRKEFPRESP